MPKNKVVAAMLAAFTVHAYAQVPTAPPPPAAPAAEVAPPVATAAAPLSRNAVAEQIARLNEEAAILAARLKAVDIQSQIASKEADAARARGGESRSSGEPVVTAIELYEGKGAATLTYTTGVRLTVREKDPIPDGWTVAKIGERRVVITRAGESKILMIGNITSLLQGQATPQQMGVR